MTKTRGSAPINARAIKNGGPKAAVVPCASLAQAGDAYVTPCINF